MKKEDFYNLPKHAGVYLLRNKINGKCYIGQAVKLRKRLLHHINNLEHDRYDAPIYRALKKYGLENFELKILRTWHDALSARTKWEMDQAEKLFIQEYNSYAPNGYNQTLGGDGGVLGYKFTEEQKEKQSVNSSITQNDGRNTVLVYNIRTKEYKEYPSRAAFGREVGLKSARAKNHLYLKTYLIGKTYEDILKELSVLNSKSAGTKINLDKLDEFIEYARNNNVADTISHFGICRRTYYLWKNKYYALNNA